MSHLDNLESSRAFLEELSSIETLNINKTTLNILINDIEASRSERVPIELVITTCPDYSRNAEGRFTFQGIDNGIGLVACQTTEALIPLLEVLFRNNVFCKVTFAYADIEADDPDILEAMNISSAKFHEVVEQSIVKAYLYLKRILHERQLDNFISVDSLGMTGRFYKPEIVATAETLMKTSDGYQITNVANKRVDMVSRMFQRSIHGYNDFYAFLMRRAKKDVKDHFIVSEAVRRERNSGQKVSIVSMDIPELAKCFNAPGQSKVPVITINQNY